MTNEQTEKSLLALCRAIKKCEGQTALARKIGVKQGHVWAWLNRDKRVPAEYVLPITRVTEGDVTPHSLRPDLYPDPAWMPKDITPSDHTASR